MTALHLDTHVVVWLYAGEHARLPDNVRARIEDEALVCSPMVRLELAYLHEIGRTTVPAHRILDELEHSTGLVEDTTAFPAVARTAESLIWTRDPFDRVIAAQALAAFGTLVTKDDHLRHRLGQYAFWG
ncbi:MAG TPA: PIN domain-containing protein [Nocardioides sp.]|nr:PIN domain-containing protein [Nocardioides sp.]